MVENHLFCKGRSAMKEYSTFFVGLDQHKNSIAVAYAPEGREPIEGISRARPVMTGLKLLASVAAARP